MPTIPEITAETEQPLRKLPVTPSLILLYVGGVPLQDPYRIIIGPNGRSFGRAVESSDGFRLDDKRASRVHALVQNEAPGRLHVADMGSRNGIFVNGQRVEKSLLRDGDILRLGDTLLLTRFEHILASEHPCNYLIGESKAAIQLRSNLARVAASTLSVLLLGETGCGKEVAARYLHENSGRRGPLITVNASALPESLVESLLFGHGRGAFTGAVPQQGFFRAAQGGTLFIDEVGELPITVQPKLLRVLEERIVYPVGAVVGQPVDVRFIFATNRNLQEAAVAGKFRNDLYARIAQSVVELAPLRLRIEDVFQLLQYSFPKSLPFQIPPDLAEALLLHRWPFNIREVVKLATELSVTGDAEAISARLQQQRKAPAPPPANPDSPGQTPGREQLITLLHRHHGNVSVIARMLNSPRKHVYRWLDEHRLNPDSYRN